VVKNVPWTMIGGMLFAAIVMGERRADDVMAAML